MAGRTRAPVPTEDELTAKGGLFAAVERLFDALAKSGPLVLLLDDLHWLDGASLDLLRYLGHCWSRHGSRVLLLGTVRCERLELNQQLVDLERDLQLSQITLQPLSQEETLQLLQALVGEGEHGRRKGGEVRERITAQPAPAGTRPAPARETKLWALGDFLFAHTGGQPLYLLETLKLLREREWLVPRLGADGTWRLELAVEMATVVAQERTRHELLPPSLRTLILARLSKLTQPARQLVMVSAVLGKEVSVQHLWQVAGLGVQVGLEALEEAVKSGMLREEPAGAGRPGGYGFAYKLVRDVVYTELGGGVAVPLAAARPGAAASRRREGLRTGLSGALDLRGRGGLSLQHTSRG